MSVAVTHSCQKTKTETIGNKPEDDRRKCDLSFSPVNVSFSLCVKSIVIFHGSFSFLIFFFLDSSLLCKLL